jgi:hypothetical protein
VTVVGATSGGSLSLYTGGTTWPGTSSLNYPAGPPFDGTVAVGVSGGQLVVHNAGQAVDVTVDVTAVLAAPAVSSGGGQLTTVVGTRLLDTRVTGGPLAAGTARVITVAGTPAVPAGARAVLVNLTGISRGATTGISAWATGGPLPTSPALRLGAGDLRANAAMLPVAADGTITVRSSVGAADLVVDVMGYVP